MNKNLILVFCSLVCTQSSLFAQEQVSLGEIALVTRMMHERNGGEKKQEVKKSRMQKLLQSKIIWALSGIVGVGVAIGAVQYWRALGENNITVDNEDIDQIDGFEISDNISEDYENNFSDDFNGTDENLTNQKSTDGFFKNDGSWSDVGKTLGIAGTLGLTGLFILVKVFKV